MCAHAAHGCARGSEACDGNAEGKVWQAITDRHRTLGLRGGRVHRRVASKHRRIEIAGDRPDGNPQG